MPRCHKDAPVVFLQVSTMILGEARDHPWPDNVLGLSTEIGGKYEPCLPKEVR